MRLSLLLFALALSFTHQLSAEPVHLLCNHLVNPLGIDAGKPRLSWQSNDAGRNWTQSAYRILVARNQKLLSPGAADVWDSGKISSAQSLSVLYAGPDLVSRQRYFWTVQVWDSNDKASSLAPAAWWETGLLTPQDWHAQWISRTNPEDTADRSAMNWLTLPQGAQDLPAKTSGSFKKTFQLAKSPASALLFVIARGDVVALVNGHQVASKSDWADFDVKDVSFELTPGENTIELKLTARAPSPYGPPAKYRPTAVAAMFKIRMADGTLTRIGSDESWGHVAGTLNEPSLIAPGPLPQPAAVFQHEFSLVNNIQSARLYVTALGSYRATLNGKAPDDSRLTPDFTDYRKHVGYQTYDVTSLVRNGRNAIGFTLGDGWYSSPFTWNGARLNPAPSRLMAQLDIQYTDGKSTTVVTDQDWKTAASPIQFSQIYAGEDYDARLETAEPTWANATIAEKPNVKLIGLLTQPVHVNETLKPISVTADANGSFIFDFGQNMVGWTELKVKGRAGTRVRMRFAEILNPNGSIYRENLRNADSTDTYILKGGNEETFAPSFTFHGFRYVEVTGYPGKPRLNSLSGKVVGSLHEPYTTKLETSSELVNKMWKIGLWGQRGNFVSVPTDCPQRDERLGWMGDAGVFWRTGSYNFDIAAFSRKFMLDVNDGQTSKGDFANVSPDLLSAESPGSEGAPGWSDAGVIIPYTSWLQYGDVSYIDDNWEAMQSFMQYIINANPDYLRKQGNGPDFADWLAPDTHTPKDLVATAYWALSANMMATMAKASGRTSDATKYDELVQNIRAAYQKAYINSAGEVTGGTQTAYLLTVYAHLAPELLEAGMMKQLVSDIETRNGHLSTGFLGTPFLLFTLADHGRSDVAYRLLLNETYPSWGYMLSKGATTWWERWNGDSGDPAMNSFNHYAFGSVMAWVYRSVAGIDTQPEGPGFQTIVIRPHTDPRMTRVHARVQLSLWPDRHGMDHRRRSVSA